MVDNQFIKVVEHLKDIGVITSQKQLCEVLGYKQQAFSEIMQGRSKVNTSLIQDFCKKYDVSLDWLFYNEGDMFISGTDANYSNNNNINNGGDFSSVNGDVTITAKLEHHTLVDEVVFLRGQIIEKDKQISFFQTMLAKLNI